VNYYLALLSIPEIVKSLIGLCLVSYLSTVFAGNAYKIRKLNHCPEP